MKLAMCQKFAFNFPASLLLRTAKFLCCLTIINSTTVNSLLTGFDVSLLFLYFLFLVAYSEVLAKMLLLNNALQQTLAASLWQSFFSLKSRY